MNILLWVLQILLAVYSMMTAIYTVFNYEILAKQVASMNALPKPAWMALGVLQVLFALGLVLPGAARVLPKLTPIAAACLAVEILLVGALNAYYAVYPIMIWALVPRILAAYLVPGILAAFVAYGRFELKPL